MAGMTTSAEGTADRESRPALPLPLPLRDAETELPASERPSSESPSGPRPGSLRELMTVAVPLVLSSGSLSLMIAIDRLFLTWFSEDALAASLPAAALHWTAMSAFIGTINYANAFVAQYEGAGRKDRVVAAVWQAVYLAVLGGAIFLIFLPFTSTIFDSVGH